MFVPRNTTEPFFYADPDALQMFFDKIISSGRITIWQGRTIATGIYHISA